MTWLFRVYNQISLRPRPTCHAADAERLVSLLFGAAPLRQTARILILYIQREAA